MKGVYARLRATRMSLREIEATLAGCNECTIAHGGRLAALDQTIGALGQRG
jgi:hypothetical protein